MKTNTITIMASIVIIIALLLGACAPVQTPAEPDIGSNRHVGKFLPQAAASHCNSSNMVSSALRKIDHS